MKLLYPPVAIPLSILLLSQSSPTTTNAFQALQRGQTTTFTRLIKYSSSSSSSNTILSAKGNWKPSSQNWKKTNDANSGGIPGYMDNLNNAAAADAAPLESISTPTTVDSSSSSSSSSSTEPKLSSSGFPYLDAISPVGSSSSVKGSYRYNPKKTTTPSGSSTTFVEGSSPKSLSFTTVPASSNGVPQMTTPTDDAPPPPVTESSQSSGGSYLDNISPVGDAPVKKSYRYKPHTTTSSSSSSGMPYTPPPPTVAAVSESVVEPVADEPISNDTFETTTSTASSSGKFGYLDNISPVGASDSPVKKSYRYKPQTSSSSGATTSSGMPYTPPAIVTESSPEVTTAAAAAATTESDVSGGSKGGYLDGISPVGSTEGVVKKSYRYKPQTSSSGASLSSGMPYTAPPPAVVSESSPVVEEVAAAAATTPIPEAMMESPASGGSSSSGFSYLDNISPVGASDAPVKKSYRYKPQTSSSGSSTSSGLPYTPAAAVVDTESPPEVATASVPIPDDVALSPEPEMVVPTTEEKTVEESSRSGSYLDGISPVGSSSSSPPKGSYRYQPKKDTQVDEEDKIPFFAAKGMAQTPPPPPAEVEVEVEATVSVDTPTSSSDAIPTIDDDEQQQQQPASDDEPDIAAASVPPIETKPATTPSPSNQITTTTTTDSSNDDEGFSFPPSFIGAITGVLLGPAVLKLLANSTGWF